MRNSANKRSNNDSVHMNDDVDDFIAKASIGELYAVLCVRASMRWFICAFDFQPNTMYVEVQQIHIGPRTSNQDH